jgi:formylglycine-generating enzyme required for sulfatase activity
MEQGNLRLLANGQTVFNRYRLKMLVGKGAMGLVWRAEDLELNLDIALKFLAEEFLFDAGAIADLKRETRRGMALAHPNIVRIYGFFHAENYAAIAMEYVEGNTLATLQAARHEPRFEVGEISEWVRQLCSALDYAHNDARVVHRDLKPGNLMVDDRGRMKIADFGIAGELNAAHTRVAGTHDTRGTLSYMSPQQLLGQRPSVDHDVYALGATIYDLLTGRPAFSTGDVSLQVRTVTPPPISMRRSENGYSGEPIPVEWEQTIAACLAKDATQRPASAAEVATRLGLGPVSPLGTRSPHATGGGSRPAHPAATHGPATHDRAPPTQVQPAAATVLGTNERPPANALVVTPGGEVQRPPTAIRPRLTWIAGGFAALLIFAIVAGFAVYVGARLAREPRPEVAKAESSKTAPPAATEQRVESPVPKGEKKGPPLGKGMVLGPDGRPRPAPFGTPPSFRAVNGPRETLAHPRPEHPLKLPDSGLELVWIPEGNNAVGVPARADGPPPNESPATDVFLNRGFWLGKYEVSRGHFTNVMGFNPSEQHLGAEYPVSNVSWKEATEFCRKLTAMEHRSGRLPRDLEYTLPTEAQWEYAAKCGFVGRYGSHETLEQAAWGDWSKVPSPQPCGKREANGWGVHDMFGNVGEWCRDWYADQRPGGRIDEDYTGPATGTLRVWKGGSYADSDFMMRASARTPLAPDARDPRVGFRLALILRTGEK